jgi:hypothetical protein
VKLATNSIAQDDTKEIALEHILLAGWSVVRATKSMPWPGEATLEVSKVWQITGTDGGSSANVVPDLPLYRPTMPLFWAS